MNNLKDLEKLIKLCHKHNVKAVKFEGIELTLGEKPHTYQPKKRQNLVSESILTPEQDMIDTMFTRALAQQTQTVTETIQADVIDTDELTDEQKMFGSSDPNVWDN